MSLILLFPNSGGGGPTAYTLDVTPAAFAVTGSTQTLLYARKLQSTAASYAITGSNAVTLYKRRIEASPAAYTVTAFDVGLTYTQSATAYTLDVTPAAFTIAGNDAQLMAGRAIGITPSALSLSFSDVDASISRVLSVDPASIGVSLASVELLYSGGEVVSSAPRRHAGNRRGYIFKGKRYWLNHAELAQLIRDEQARIQDVMRLKRNKPKTISAETAKAINAIIASLNLPTETEQQTITHQRDNDDDEALELMLTL